MDQTATPVRASADSSVTQEAEREGERYQTLFDGVPVGLFRVSSDGRLIEINATAIRMLGYPDRNTLLDEDPLDLPVDPALRGEYLEKILNGEETAVPIRRFDGDTAWATVSLNAVRDAGGQVAHYEGALLDTSARQAAKAELRIKGAILDQLPLAMIQTDLEGTVTEWNRHSEALYGWSAEEAVGRNIADLAGTEKMRRAVESLLASVRRDGSWRGELETASTQGRRIRFWAMATLMRDAGGDPVGMLGFCHDLTELRHVQSDLARRMDQHVALARISRLAIDVKDLDYFLRRSVEILATSISLEEVAVWELAPNDELSVRATTTSASHHEAEPRDPQIVELALSEREPVVATVIGDHAHPTQAAAVIGNGRPWGVLSIAGAASTQFTEDDIYFIESAANLITAVVSRAQADTVRDRLAEILENTTDFVGTADHEGNAIYANRAARHTAGLDEEADVSRLQIDSFQPEWAVDMIRNEGIPIALSEGVWSGRTAFFDPILGEVPTSQLIIAHPGSNGRPPLVSTVARDLTHELEAARRLGESEALVGKAFLESTVPSAVLDLESRVVRANGAMLRFLDSSTDELIGRHYSDFTAPEHRLVGASEARQVARGELPFYAVEKKYLRGNGSEIWGLLNLSPILGEDALPQLLFAQLIDIDHRRRAEEQISFQASILDQVRNAVIATDLDGSITYWNRFAEEMLGWEASEMLGRNVMEAVGADAAIASATSQIFDDLARRGRRQCEGTLTGRDGTAFPVWLSLSTVADEANKPIAVVAVAMDLSEVRAAHALLQLESRRAESVLGSVRFPVAVLDDRGKITEVNREWRRFAIENGGNPVTTGVGVNYLDVCRNAGSDPYALEVLAGIESVLDGDISGYTVEYPCNSPSEDRWFEIEVSPMPGGGAVVVHWDITTEKRVREALEETIRAKDQFIAALSHELRTPLTAILGLTQELRDGSFPAEEADDFHRIIAEQAEEVALLVEDLLVAARIDSETLAVKREAVALNAAIDRVLAPWRSTKELEIRVTGAAGVTLQVDGSRFRQVLRNLIMNAVRHGAEPISVAVSRAGDRAIISVTDHGAGIPDSALDLIFQPYAAFAQGDGRPASVGLGLFVARGLTERMGGSLQYHRRDGHSVFELDLPLASVGG